MTTCCNTTTCYDRGRDFPDREMVRSLATTGGELCGACATNRSQRLMSWLGLAEHEWEVIAEPTQERLWAAYMCIPIRWSKG
jgi:hypothetical protein